MNNNKLEILENILEGQLRANLKEQFTLNNEWICKLISSNFNDDELIELTKWMNKEIYLSEKIMNDLLTVLEAEQENLMLAEWLEKNIQKY